MGQVTQAFPHLELESETKIEASWQILGEAKVASHLQCNDRRPAAEIARHAGCQKDLYVKSSNNTTVKVKPLFLDQVKAVGVIWVGNKNSD